MALRPDPEVGFRRPGDHRLAGRPCRASRIRPGVAAGRLGDAARSGVVGGAVPRAPLRSGGPALAGRGDDPARAHTRLGLLRERRQCREPRGPPDSRFRLRVTGSGFDSEWSWQLEPAAGGTRVIHSADVPAQRPLDRHPRAARRLVGPEPGRAHLRASRSAEAAESTRSPPRHSDRMAMTVKYSVLTEHPRDVASRA